MPIATMPERPRGNAVLCSKVYCLHMMQHPVWRGMQRRHATPRPASCRRPTHLPTPPPIDHTQMYVEGKSEGAMKFTCTQVGASAVTVGIRVHKTRPFL